jgi:hypothetical protein
MNNKLGLTRLIWKILRLILNIACRVVERERIVGTIVQGFTCLDTQASQNLHLHCLKYS